MSWLTYRFFGDQQILLMSVLFTSVFISQASAQLSEFPAAERDVLEAEYAQSIMQASFYANHAPDSATVTEQQDIYRPRWYSMVTNLPSDLTRFASESFQTQKIPLYVGIAGITVGLMTIDNHAWLKERTWYNHSSVFRNLTDDLVWAGDGRVQFGLAGVFAAYGLAFDNNRALRTGSEIAEAVLASGAVDQLIKHISGRERPSVASQPGGDWTFVPNQISYIKHVPHYDAFPSGHITSATSVLVVIAENYHELTWLRPASYVLMSGISMSLVAYGYHWWSDIPLGIFLGYSFGEIVSHQLALSLGSNSSDKSPRLLLRPVMVQGGVGLGLKLSF